MADQVRSADQMLNLVLEDPARLNALKTNPLPELQKLRNQAVEEIKPAYVGDNLLYRIAIIVLGALTLTAAIGSIILVLGGRDTPEVLVALGSAAVGALVGLFAPSPTGK